MVPEFYDGREIFITGGSGVVGKALIEKLLRSCNVAKIYILLRPKKNFTIGERLKKLKQEMIYRRLRTEKPNEFDDKVVAIPGDVGLPLLGITPDYLKLMENVTIVFHGAATVRFDEPLRQALKLNVGGTLEALKFAESLKHLEIFMHVSTFFSNPYLQYVDTKLYEAPMDWEFCLNIARRNDIPDETLECITRKLITGFPNTYCFTKNLAESLVNHYQAKLPVVIYRPAIVIFSVDDPEPGFATSLMGAMGIFALTGAGIIKTVYAGKHHRPDFSPLDIVIKCMLYYAIKSVNIYANNERPTVIPVFHTSSCTHSNIGTREYLCVGQDYGFWKEAAYENNLLVPGLICTENRLVYMSLIMLKQILPALLVDLLLRLNGRKPALMKAQRKIFVSLEVLKPFLFNAYQSNGVTYAKEMQKLLHGTDFHMDILETSNNKFHCIGSMRDMIFNMREVLFKEDPSTLPRSRMILKIKIISYKIIQIILAYKLYHMILSTLSNWQKIDAEYVNNTELLHN